jgi:hypothetical protein
MDSPIFGMSMDGRPCNLKFLLWGNNQYNEPRYYFCSSFKSLVLEPTNMMVVSVVWTFHLLHIRQKHPSTERRCSLATPRLHLRDIVGLRFHTLSSAGWYHLKKIRNPCVLFLSSMTKAKVTNLISILAGLTTLILSTGPILDLLHAFSWLVQYMSP